MLWPAQHTTQQQRESGGDTVAVVLPVYQRYTGEVGESICDLRGLGGSGGEMRR
jgi:hypothetical protein